MTAATLLAQNAALIAGAMLLLWGLSLRLRNASIVDIWWGPGIGLVAVATLIATGADHPRRWLLTGMAVLWSLRLGGYLFWRNAGHGEDPRYQAMRRHWGNRFPWVSALTVFALQGVLQWWISLPIQLGQLQPGATALGPWDALGALVFVTGLGFESVGDAQLSRFRADPTNAGQVMDRGLWRYTRHPNYFGDCLAHWGIYGVALATPLGWLALLSPVAMTVVLLRVSGVALLERSIGRRRPAYDAYRQRTSTFLPRPARDD